MTKNGFSLVTVLFLIVGIAITLGGVAFNFVTEGHLQKVSRNNEDSFSAAEIGLESAKMWLQNKVINGGIPAETSIVKANLGDPRYCLKGFQVNEINSLHSFTSNINQILNIVDKNRYNEASFEYYIEDATVDYRKEKEPDNEIDKPHIYIGDYTGSYIYTYNLDLSPSESYPVVNYPETGFRAPHNKSPFLKNRKFLYLGHSSGSYIIVYDVTTGEPVKGKYKQLPRYLEPEEGFHASHTNSSILKYDKYIVTNCASGQFTCLYNMEEGVPAPASEFDIVNDPNTGFRPGIGETESVSAAIDETNNTLYLGSKNLPIIRVYDLNDRGKPHKDFCNLPKRYEPACGFEISTEGSPIKIDDKYLYVQKSNWGRNYIHVYDKKTGKPAPESDFNRIPRGDGNVGFNIYHSDNFFIENNMLYNITSNGNYLLVHDLLKKGDPSLLFNPPIHAGDNINQKFYTGIRLPAGDAGIHVDKDTSSQENLNYYRIRSCGYGANNSIKRIENIISVETTNKTIKQISWKEVF